MEWTLLRFMQILLSEITETSASTDSTESNNPVDSTDIVYGYKFNGLENSPLNINPELKNYINKYPNIYKNTKHYISDEGIDERGEWCELLSDHDNLFEYYRTDKAELFTNIKNILIFYKYFFGLNLNIELENDDQTNLNIIANYFSQILNKSIELEIIAIDKKNQQMTIDDMFMYLSKDDADFNNQKNLDKQNRKKNKYNVVNSTTQIVIVVNDDEYIWTLYEMYINDEKVNFNNKFITGHSVISIR
jgi:hypothetical protein